MGRAPPDKAASWAGLASARGGPPPNQANAIRFLQLLFGSAGVAIQQAVSPPMSPPVASLDFHAPEFA